MVPIAFVAGATGYTGREVVRALAERGVQVVAHVRPDSSRLEEWRRRFGALGAGLDTTAWDEDAMAATLASGNITHVFALLGTTRARAQAEGASYDSVDYGLTAMLIRAAARMPTHPRFVYLSSLGVTEGTRNPYLQARARAEQELRSSGLAWTIARPSFITGDDRDERRLGERVAATVADAGLGLLGRLGATGLRDRYSSLTGAELADALVHHAFAPESLEAILEADVLHLPAAARP